MDIILIPGLWLDGSSWAAIVPWLEASGHRAHPVTLPGMESPDSPRAGVGLAEHVDAVVAAIDACGSVDRVMVVGHSAGAGIAHGAIDARPDRVARVVHVAGFPTPHGMAVASGFPIDGDDIPLPVWDAFDDADLAGLSGDDLAQLRSRAIPSPASLTRDPQRLADDRRHDVPATVVCTEFTSEELVGWLEQGMGPVAELDRIRHVEFVDLPTGHWPQFTRAADLAAIILDRAQNTWLDEHGRLHPPSEGGETVTTLGFLDYQRATLDWKTRGLGAAGLNATVAPSSLTLGGLLKHMAWVEDHWFSKWLHGREPSRPWSEADWGADRDWEFTSASHDPPEALRDLWRRATLRSRALTAAAIAAGGLDHRATRTDEDGETVNLRWILHHMIEEYARHNGHADLLRESIDGATGE